MTLVAVSGRKVVKRELEIAGNAPFTNADQAELKKFKQRPAGRKLFRDLILKNAAAMAEVMTRLDRHLRECAFRRQSDMDRGIPKVRRQTPAVPPFATTELALIVQIYQQREQPWLVDFGQKRLALIAQRPHQTHMLTGQTAEVVRQGLRSKPLQLTVRRAGAPSYSIPVRRLDFDFAYAEFSECLTTSGNNLSRGGPSSGASQLP